jgi:lambda repressor-like predicted transcriptional regulator
MQKSNTDYEPAAVLAALHEQGSLMQAPQPAVRVSNKWLVLDLVITNSRVG